MKRERKVDNKLKKYCNLVQLIERIIHALPLKRQENFTQIISYNKMAVCDKPLEDLY